MFSKKSCKKNVLGIIEIFILLVLVPLTKHFRVKKGGKIVLRKKSQRKLLILEFFMGSSLKSLTGSKL